MYSYISGTKFDAPFTTLRYKRSVDNASLVENLHKVYNATKLM